MKYHAFHTHFLRLAPLMMLATSSLPVVAQTAEAKFVLIDSSGRGNVQLANGQPVTNPADWTALANTTIRTIPLPDGSIFSVTCTATLIGPGVLLTAAHCFDKGGSDGLSLGASLSTGGQTFKLNCEVAPEYESAANSHLSGNRLPRVPQDYALCQFAMPKPAPAQLASVRFAVVDTKVSLSSGESVVMTGFGCSSIRIDPETGIVAGASDNTLRIGLAPVTDAANPAGPYDAAFIIIVSSGKARPILCPGDSGGPLMSPTMTAGKPAAPYRVRGVNSQVTTRTGGAGYPILVSAIAPLATDAFRSFLANWLKADPTRRICGANAPNRVPPCAD